MWIILCDFLHPCYASLGRRGKESGSELRAEPPPWPLHLLYNQFGPGGSISHKSLWEECKVRHTLWYTWAHKHHMQTTCWCWWYLSYSTSHICGFHAASQKCRPTFFFFCLPCTRNPNKIGNTALLCRFISSFMVVAQIYITVYKWI